MPICLAACSTTDQIAQPLNPSPIRSPLRTERNSRPCLNPAADVG